MDRATKPSKGSKPIWPESAPARVSVLARFSQFLGEFEAEIPPPMIQIVEINGYGDEEEELGKKKGPDGLGWPDGRDTADQCEAGEREFGQSERETTG